MYLSIEGHEGQHHFITIYFPGFVCLCISRPRYQVSVYRTIGPLVTQCLENKLTERDQILYTHHH